jgi:hypothetical protein
MITRVPGVASDARAGSRGRETAPQLLPGASKKPLTTMAARPVAIHELGRHWDDLTSQVRWRLLTAAGVYPKNSARLKWAHFQGAERAALAQALSDMLTLGTRAL